MRVEQQTGWALLVCQESFSPVLIDLTLIRNSN
jgi:hypothetical protein